MIKWRGICNELIKLIKLLVLLILVSCISCEQKKELYISIQPYDRFNSSTIDSIKSTLEIVYQARISINQTEKLPKSAFTSLKAPRYRADSIIKILKERKPDSIDFILGLTNEDISTTKRDEYGAIKKPESKYKDWGIFGLGYRPGASAIVSTYRIGNLGSSKYLNRLKKICGHEIGHNLGLTHCTSSENCIMRDAAEKISTIDFVELKLCSTCKSQLNL